MVANWLLLHMYQTYYVALAHRCALNIVRYAACMGLGGLCVVGGVRHGRVWVTDAARLYQPSPDTISAPRAHEVPASGQYVQDLWGKFSPNPLPHFLTEEAVCSKPLIW